MAKSFGISVFGLGKLGVPMVACFASKGYDVIGVDIHAQTVEKLNRGVSPVFEPGLDSLLRSGRERIRATQDYREAVLGSDISFIIVPTPSDTNGAFRNDFVLESIKGIGSTLREKQGEHLVVLTSTVLPGTMACDVLPALELSSGKQCGSDFGLCYNPEFIALGNVIHDILNPDFVLIGESDEDAGKKLEMFYQTVCNNHPPISRMNWVNAELTKIAVNTFVTTKISYANMLAEMCEHLPGADVEMVTKALGQDARIGKKYLQGALGYGGPCFPRDNVAFNYLAESLGVKASVSNATDEINNWQVQRLAEKVFSHLPARKTVGILGLSYKPNTNVVERSQGLELAQFLIAKGAPVVLYDPCAMEEARKAVEDQSIFAASLRDCVRRADVLVITTPWDEFKTIEPEDLLQKMSRTVIIDCWRILDRARYSKISDYIVLGAGEKLPRPITKLQTTTGRARS